MEGEGTNGIYVVCTWKPRRWISHARREDSALIPDFAPLIVMGTLKPRDPIESLLKAFRVTLVNRPPSFVVSSYPSVHKNPVKLATVIRLNWSSKKRGAFGIAAIVKAQNPSWSPSAIKSAIMTTAIQSNNLKAPITLNSGSVATPYDIGAGEASPSSAINPGLVYETYPADYLQFLCSIGYDTLRIKLISKTVPDDFLCPTNSSSESISKMNYPSVAVSNFKQNETKKITKNCNECCGRGSNIHCDHKSTIWIGSPSDSK